ncbi:MAG: glycosyltransferase family 1 protein [Bacteroidaceae bacterium]|nr:glycosyltransferase family 1 protein [Bacteroidaceae bacterium]
MRILLIGEYSNVHWTLAEGLRALGHTVCVVSNGDFWKNYNRDISLVRDVGSRWGGVKYLFNLLATLPKLRGYDVVQLINPCFVELKAERIYPVYRYLKRNNRKVFLGGFGMDYYWVNTCRTTQTFRYSDFNFGTQLRDSEGIRAEVREWIEGEKGRLNRYIAEDCDGIVAGLYEYYACYQPVFPEKTCFIPFPIKVEKLEKIERKSHEQPIRFFIGIQRTRNEYKGTHIMLRALERVCSLYPGRCEMVKVESVPYEQYQQLMDSSDVLLDQLYSYTPAMNALVAMGKGLIVVGGGEEENYEILGEKVLRPIVNVLPDEEHVFKQLEWLVLHPEEVRRLAYESREYVVRHHDYIKVAQRYLDFWQKEN